MCVLIWGEGGGVNLGGALLSAGGLVWVIFTLESRIIIHRKFNFFFINLSFVCTEGLKSLWYHTWFFVMAQEWFYSSKSVSDSNLLWNLQDWSNKIFEFNLNKPSSGDFLWFAFITSWNWKTRKKCIKHYCERNDLLFLNKYTQVCLGWVLFPVQMIGNCLHY